MDKSIGTKGNQNRSWIYTAYQTSAVFTEIYLTPPQDSNTLLIIHILQIMQKIQIPNTFRILIGVGEIIWQSGDRSSATCGR